MSRKRRRRNPITGSAKVRWNPIDTKKVVWAVGILAGAGALGTIIYFATKKKEPELTTNEATPPTPSTVTPAKDSHAVAPTRSTPQGAASEAPMAFAQALRYSPPPLNPDTGDY